MKTPTLLILSLTLFINPVMGADWPQWRGPDRNDISKETGLLKEWPQGGPKLLWTFREAGIGFSSFAVVGDFLYTQGAEQGKENLFAIDLKTQKKAWSTEVGPQFNNGWGDGPRGTPTVDGDRIYAIGGQGYLVCITTKGEKLWTKKFKEELGGSMMSGWGYTESPLIDGDKVVATPGGSKGTIAAFNKMTGDLLWRSTEYTDPAAYSSLIVAETGGVRQYIQMTGKSVAGVSAKDGKLLWRYDRTGPTAAIPTPVYGDNAVFATSGYGAGCHFIKLTEADGTLKATEGYANKNMTNHHGGVVLLDGHVYGYSDGKGWVCLDFKTGQIKWSDNRSLGKGSVTFADGLLYCYSERDGTCAIVEANTTGWKEKGRLTIPERTKVDRKRGQIWTHPVVANGRLYLRDQDLIFCFDISAKQ